MIKRKQTTISLLHFCPHLHSLRSYIILLLFLQVGEQILTINGESTENMTHKDAVTLLKQAEGCVDMEVAPATDDSSSAAEDNDGSDEESLPGYVSLINILSMFSRCMSHHSSS